MTAVQYASGGDTISLAPGEYSNVIIKSLQFTSPVTITSADPHNPAVLSDMEVTSVKGLTIQNVAIHTGADLGLTIAFSKDVVVNHVDVSGPSADKLDGSGIKVDHSTNVVVSNSSFHELGYGFTHVSSENVKVTGNTFENIRTDGIRGGGSSFVEISGNSLQNFYRNPGEHGDAIQFWTMGTTTSAHDIVIKDNLIARDDGGVMQGIFFGDESKGKLPYLNVQITGNTILGAAYNGIDLYPAKGAVISGNTVIGFSDMNSSIRVDGSANVSLSNNVASNFSLPTGGNTNLTQSANKTVALINATTDDPYVTAFLKAHPAVATALAGSGVAESSKAVTGTVTDVLVGDKNANTLTGTNFADLINGGKGADTMIGGGGDDRYVVDNAKDSVVELAGGGIDTVYSSSTYKLAANVENLTLTSTAWQQANGNELNNVIRSNGVFARIYGEAGNDTIVSTGGGDDITGGAGADTFRFEALPSRAALITDFVSGQDHLDLHSLLTAHGAGNPLTDGWVKVQADATGLTVLVDMDGPQGAGQFVAVANLAGVKALAAADWVF